MRKVVEAICAVLMIVLGVMLLVAKPDEAKHLVDPTPSAAPAPPTSPPITLGPIIRTKATIWQLPKVELRQGRYIVIDLSEQRLYELQDGTVTHEPIKVSTGVGGHSTPTGEFQIYRKLHGSAWSQKWHGWMYDLLMFNGLIYIHGTSESNYSLLGQPASHGCVRVHQDQAHRLIDKFEVGDTVIVQA